MKEYDWIRAEKMWKYNAKIMDRWFDLILLVVASVVMVWFAVAVVGYWSTPYVPTLPIEAIM